MDAVMQIYTAEVTFPDGGYIQRHCLDYDTAYWNLCNVFKLYEATDMSYYEEFQNNIIKDNYYNGTYERVYRIYPSFLYKLNS